MCGVCMCVCVCLREFNTGNFVLTYKCAYYSQICHEASAKSRACVSKLDMICLCVDCGSFGLRFVGTTNVSSSV